MIVLRQKELSHRCALVVTSIAFACQFALGSAADALAAPDETTPPTTSEASADQASPAAAGGDVTYTRHIAPILWKHCAGCHRPDEIGPFPLLSYTDAAKRAEFLVQVTSQRRMPPWKPEADFGKFHDERRLSAEQITLIGQWARQGAPEGDPSDLPTPPSFTPGWQLGKPDLVLKMAQPFTIPAGGRDVYRCFVIPIDASADLMISAVEFRPGNRKVVHHAIMFLDSNGQGRKRDGEDGQPGFSSFGGPGIIPTGGLGTWVPGAMTRHMPDGIGRYIKKGSDLVLQLHYHPSGKEETDQSTLGLYFAAKPVKKIVSGIAIVQPEMVVPAGAPRHEITAETQALPADVSVLGVSPHMHNLGREFKVTAQRPGGGEETPLIWIKDWDFNWQGAYEFAKPVRLPKGSVIKVSAIYDNSSANSKNPNNPPQTVKWGEQTSDEMCLCGVQVFTETMADLRKIASMPGNEMGAGLEGGMPGLAALAKKKEVAQKKRASDVSKSEELEKLIENVAIPAEGVPIPERFRAFMAPYNQDADAMLSRAEFDALPPALQRAIRIGLVKKAGRKVDP
jgi:mono/diheme cytochrome c family protein